MSQLLCVVSACDNVRDKKSRMCSSCRHRKQRYGDPQFSPRVTHLVCTVSGCHNKHLSRGFCKRHYDSLQKYGDPTTVDNKSKYCSVCQIELDASSRKGNHCRPCYLVGMRRSKVIKTYGEEAGDLFDRIAEGAPCDACGRIPSEKDTRRFHIDHNHKTGAVRGILCHACNVSLGLLEEDSERIVALASYLLTTEGIIPTPEELEQESLEGFSVSEEDLILALAVDEQKSKK